ncbi:hypothetical protein [Micromonospora sp. KC723]|uniref:hypothetical protein n=1 Tax=Micromonospora sp. KC723 TaxID=2530381 RepID=UPI0010512E44|nr:hypothetical protein [Micromonospora sp. KC723]TDB75428.1 hypothetical protein E1165_11175 [Micromonospora sp. KC723]
MQTARARLVLLFASTALPAAAEAAAMHAVGFLRTRAIAPQFSAVWPYSMFHDLRWVLVYHNSWFSLGTKLLAAVVVHGLLCAVYVALAWPMEIPRPPLRRLAGRSLVFAAFIALLLLPWATIAVATAQFALAWILLLELVPLLVLAPLVARGGVVSDWWRGLPTLRLAGWSLLTFVALTIGGALVAATPGWFAVATAGAMGAVNGLIWLGLVRDALRQKPVLYRLAPVAPIVAALTVASVYAVDLVAVRLISTGPQSAPSTTVLPPVPQAVIYLAGFNSTYPGDPAPPAGPVWRFSYRGTNADGRARPYAPSDTHQSIVDSARLLAEQVDRVHAVTGRPVALIGESAGAMIVRFYLARLRHPAVTSAVLSDPLVRAGRTYYPPPGADSGWGIGTGWLLRGLLVVPGGPLPDDVDQPFLRSLLDNAPLFRNELLCPVPGVRMMALLPTIDTLALPPPGLPDIPLIEVGAIHAPLINRPAVQKIIGAFLNGELGITPERRRYRGRLAFFVAWQAPALPIRLNPVWRTQTDTDVLFQRVGCPA